MSDPLALFSMALAAGGGHVDDWPSGQLVAAGVTLLQRCAPLVRTLAAGRTAILLPTSAPFVTALAASEGRGAVLVNPLASVPEIAWQLADANVSAVFTNAALRARVPPAMPCVLLDDVPRSAQVEMNGATVTVDLGSHVGLALHGDPDVDGRDEEAVVVYTSAMQGTPLGAILTHRNLLGNARATAAAAHDSANDHSLALLPFSHLFGLVVSGAAPLLTGGRVTTMDRFKPLLALEVIEQRHITRLVGVPSIFAALLEAIEHRAQGLHAPALRLCLCGGAPLSAALQQRWVDATGVDLRQGYGLTETSPVCLVNSLDHPNRFDNLGTPLPGVDVSIREPGTGAPCGVDVEGEICVRGSNVFRGYVSGATDGLATRDGWLHTGDRGLQRADQSVSFRGVIKPMFTRNGYNIYPRELERVLGAMPGVMSVRARAVPSPVKDNDIALDIVGNVTETEVRTWCATHLGVYKQPSFISITRHPSAPTD